MDDLRGALVAFVAEHEFVVASQIGKRLAAPAEVVAEEADAAVGDRLLRAERLADGATATYRVTRAGLDQIGCELPVPVTGQEQVRHELGVVWLWIAAAEGAFGPAREVLSRRRMAWLDRSDAVESDGQFGIRSPAAGRDEAVLYPDVMVVLEHGRVSIHLESSLRAQDELELLLRGHADAPAAMLFMVEDSVVGESVLRVAAELGLADTVQVQRVGSISS